MTKTRTSGRGTGSTPPRAPPTPPEARRLLNRAAIVRDEAERYRGLHDERELLETDSFEAAALAYLYPETEPREGAALVPQEGPASTASAIRRSMTEGRRLTRALAGLCEVDPGAAGPSNA